MPHTLELYWDFSSPFAYLGSTQAEALAARTQATLLWRPMLLGAVFKAIGTPDVPLLGWSPAKRRYYQRDMQRWASHWNVPFRHPSRFPMNTVKALRTYLALPEVMRAPFREATFRAYWAEDRDIGDDGELRALIEGASRSAVGSVIGSVIDSVVARRANAEIKQALFDETKRAIDAGVFGAPTWVVDGKDLFWGQDRLDLVEDALTRTPTR